MTHNSTPVKTNTTQQVGPDTRVHEHRTASRFFRTADLQQARSVLAEEVSHLTCLPLDHLWKSYPLDNIDIPNVNRHLVQESLLSNKGEWHDTIRKEQFAVRLGGAREAKLFEVFSRIFNEVRSSLKDSDKPTPGRVERMVHAGSVEPQSDRTGSHRPDAFLLVCPETKSTGRRFQWRDLTCPFEYKFGNGDALDVSQHEPTAPWKHVLIVCRIIPRCCGASTTSCAATPVEFSPLESVYMVPSFVSGSYAVLHPSRSLLSTGSRSV
jgi:hypothetical protein